MSYRLVSQGFVQDVGYDLCHGSVLKIQCFTAVCGSFLHIRSLEASLGFVSVQIELGRFPCQAVSSDTAASSHDPWGLPLGWEVPVYSHLVQQRQEKKQ